MHEPGKAATLEKTLKGPASAWILYDVANTVYAATLTFIFAPYVGDLFQGRSVQGIVNSASMVASGLLVPVFASIADHTGRARQYMILMSLLCIIPMALFGATTDMVALMALFFIANFGYNAAVVFYNSLLPSVAADRNQGLVSGLGVGLGYLGTIMPLLILGPLRRYFSEREILPIMAGLFFLLSLPCFLLVRERRVTSRVPLTKELAFSQGYQLLNTLKGLPKDPRMMWFLLGNFFCVDVLNTAILFFGDFTQNTFFVNKGTPDDPQWVARNGVTLFGIPVEKPLDLVVPAGLTLNVLALLSGVLLGFLSDKLGALKAMRLSAWSLVLGLIVAAYFAGNDATLFVLGISGFGAFGLAGIWTAGRKLLIEIAPRERLGEYSGLHGIAMKLSVVGSSVFGVLFDIVTRTSGSDLTGWRAALAFQAVPLVLGIGCLYLMKHKSKLGGAQQSEPAALVAGPPA